MIKNDILNMVWEPGKQILKSASLQEQRRFENWIAQEYVRLVKEAVNDQRYKSHWKNLSPKYKIFKQNKGYSSKTWQATGELIYNLKYDKRKHRIGFALRGGKYVRNGVKYLTVARTLEFGNPFNKTPPRPLFRSVYWYMRKHIQFFYEKFKRETAR